jgi:thiosulfate/3-mercaptopyruvate sulfurtransferase
MNPIISCTELAQRLADPTLRIVDIRGTVSHEDLGDGFEKGVYTAQKAAYLLSHIPGAVFVDWTTDIVDPTQPVKAQLANPEQFAQVMSRLGIEATMEVVIYDQGVAQFATRLWWALKVYGHDRVRVLDGGWSAWTQGDFPVSADLPVITPTAFTSQYQPQWRIEPSELQELLGEEDVVIVDARPAAHYRGERSRSIRKGHIPGAVNLPRPDLLTGTQFKPLSAWQAQYEALDMTPSDTVVSYCNGGVAASTVLFALYSLGYTKLRLYDGSWNEWGNRDDLPCASILAP